MGLYIKGVEMPTCCFKCGFYHHPVDSGYYDFEYCGANNAGFNDAYDSTKPHINPFEEKLRTCPLIPVPSHGRLIDADALMKGEGRYIISFGKEGIDVAEINRAPIIISSSQQNRKENKNE